MIFGEAKQENRILWLDFARTIAIISITVNHAMSRSFNIYSETQLEFQTMSHIASYIKALVWVFSRLGVPIFLMITGALLIEKNYEDRMVLKRFIKHNWFSLVRTTMIWLTLMYLLLSLRDDSYYSLNGWGSGLFHFVSTICFINHDNKVTMASMWYMSMIICVYLMIPIVSIVLKRLGDRYIKALSIFVIFSAMVIPNINAILLAAEKTYSLNFAMSHNDMFSMYLVYILLGHWVKEKSLDKYKQIYILVLFFIGLITTSLFQYWVYSTFSDYAIRYADIGILFTSTMLFELMRRNSYNIRTGGIVTLFSRISLGIYFIHICIMEYVNIKIDETINLQGFYSVIVLEIISLGGAIIIILLLSRIQLFRKYVFLIK